MGKLKSRSGERNAEERRKKYFLFPLLKYGGSLKHVFKMCCLWALAESFLASVIVLTWHPNTSVYLWWSFPFSGSNHASELLIFSYPPK